MSVMTVIVQAMSVQTVTVQTMNAQTVLTAPPFFLQMDNVLIDDRRIHVDFSQSVGKLWSRFRKFGKKDSADATAQGTDGRLNACTLLAWCMFWGSRAYCLVARRYRARSATLLAL